MSHPTSPRRLRICQHTIGYDQGIFPFHSTTTNFQPVFLQDIVAKKQDYVDLGLFCADVCKALERGLNGRRLGDLNPSVLGAIGKLTT